MRVLVVDDSTVFRKVVRDALAAQPGVEVVGVAPDGRRALEKFQQLQPDLITLDVEMPELDGLGVLAELQRLQAEVNVIMVSAATTAAAAQTAQALRLGAFDFIQKPNGPTLERNVELLRAELAPKIAALAELAGETHSGADFCSVTPVAVQPFLTLRPAAPFRGASIVAIGVSTGGPSALSRLLPKLPASFPTPIVIVQHMPPVFTKSLADDLNRNCQLTVKEAVDGEPLVAGVVYIAPGGRQMKLAGSAAAPSVVVTDDPPERSCRPSVDYMFRSVADTFGGQTLAVILTGMGDDGTAGCRVLKRQGAQIAVQDQSSCVVYGMPRQVVEAGLADVVCPLADMHDVILRAVAKGGAG
jgi:two-component system, chemotaxis family, protein-glutamate methylesterase/glutaminase